MNATLLRRHVAQRVCRACNVVIVFSEILHASFTDLETSVTRIVLKFTRENLSKYWARTSADA